jgi:hypothetical protein
VNPEARAYFTTVPAMLSSTLFPSASVNFDTTNALSESVVAIVPADNLTATTTPLALTTTSPAKEVPIIEPCRSD